MKKLLLLMFVLFGSLIGQSQNRQYTLPIDVTNDISALQFMDIKLFVLKNGQIKSYSDIDNSVGYSFQNVEVYLNPCNLDPMIKADTIMPEENYCEMVFKIKFDSDLYNSYFQYIVLNLRGNRVFIQPIYDDLEPNFQLRKEDILIIVQNIIQQIGVKHEYS